MTGPELRTIEDRGHSRHVSHVARADFAGGIADMVAAALEAAT